MRSSMILILFVLFSSCLFSEPFTKPISIVASVKSIQDGDTVTVKLSDAEIKVLENHEEFAQRINARLRKQLNEKAIKLRFAQIDTPELSQRYGLQAKKVLQTMIPVGTELSITISDVDVYSRCIAELYKEDQSILYWINYEMVANGSAWVYKKYRTERFLDSVELRAKQEKKGLWQLDYPVYPREYRRGIRPEILKYIDKTSVSICMLNINWDDKWRLGKYSKWQIAIIPTAETIMVILAPQSNKPSDSITVKNGVELAERYLGVDGKYYPLIRIREGRIHWTQSKSGTLKMHNPGWFTLLSPGEFILYDKIARKFVDTINSNHDLVVHFPKTESESN